MISTLELPVVDQRSTLERTRRRLVTLFHLASGVLALAAACLFALWPAALGPRSMGVAVALAALGLLALGLRFAPARIASFGVPLVSSLTIVAIALAAAASGRGLLSPGLAVFALHAAVVCAIVGPGAGAVVSAVAALALALLAHNAAGVAPSLTAYLLALQLTIVAAGMAGGWAISRLIWRSAHSAHERGRRFEGLLAIAADAYWELGPDLTLTALKRRVGAGWSTDRDEGLGVLPWLLPGLRCDPETLDQLQADLESRQPFRNLHLAREGERETRHYLVSGEPKRDARGLFCGYWGVARDVTDELFARRALRATESRYQDLFERIPTPLVLHEDGRVLDANASALALFGVASLDDFVGMELLPFYEDGDSRAMARMRLTRLRDLAPGDALPVTEYRIRSRDGRRLFARATTVSVETLEGPAMLSIYVDETERRAAEDVIRRSEAMLSHLVSSSPDTITLTDMSTRRFSMVNETFERVTGYRAEEVIGRTPAELGLWSKEEQRQAFLASLARDRSVKDMAVSFRARDGSTLLMLVSGTVFRMDERDYVVMNGRDVTAAEQERQEHQVILDSASIGIAMTKDRHFLMANPAFEEMFGWPRGSLIGEPGAVIWPGAEAYAEISRQLGPTLSRGAPAEIEAVGMRRDGSHFDLRVLGRAVDPQHPAAGATIWIVEDITERKRTAQALARAKEEAEAASRAKSAFLANTSHELRTPLNHLLGLAQMARGSDHDAPRRGAYLDQIVESARLLAAIVADILDLSRIEAGKFDIEHAPFDLDALLGSLHRSLEPQAALRSLRLSLHSDGPFGRVLGDAQRVRQVLLNYLGNALKFTREGGIELRALRLDEGRLRFEVADTGPGIEAQVQARLFRPFSQADESTTRRYGGTGLGLSICAELARLMGGRVGVLSTPGRGSTFWAELPLPAVDVDGHTTAPGELASEASLAHAHVLLVDDNAVNLMIAVAQLEQAGARVAQAPDGRSALAAVAAAEAASDPFDVVLLDLQMPDMSGLDVTRELRRRLDDQALPIVAHTAAAMVSEREAALAAGMNDFLSKPTEGERLRQTVARWAGLRRARQPQPDPG